MEAFLLFMIQFHPDENALLILFPSDCVPPLFHFSLKTLALYFSTFHGGPGKLFLSSNNREDLGFYIIH